MLRNVAILIALTVVAVIGMDQFTSHMEPSQGRSQIREPVVAKVSAPKKKPEEEEEQPQEEEVQRAAHSEPDEDEEEEDSSGDGDELVLKAGAGGHYFVDAEINGEGVNFLVDTGASVVALTRQDAERLGMDLDELKYTGRAKTANGIARVAPVMLSEIEIGENVVENVQAAVIDAPMDVSLLGMSFLKRLEGFEIKDNELIMRW